MVGQRHDQLLGQRVPTRRTVCSPASALRWDVILDHCDTSTCHQHYVATFYGVDHGTFQALDHEYPSHLEIHLTATDSQGLTSTQVMSSSPFTEQLEVDTNPPGLMVTNQSASGPSPLVQTVIRGATVLVGVDSPQASAATATRSRRGPTAALQGHTVNIFADTVLTATLQLAQPAVSIGTTLGDGRAGAVPVVPADTVRSVGDTGVGRGEHVNGTAIAGTDYTSTSSTVSFAAGTDVGDLHGADHRQYDTSARSDVVRECSRIRSGRPSAPRPRVGAILDDETADMSVVDAKPVLEGPPGTTNPMKFIIPLDHPSPVPVTFTATATTGTANGAGLLQEIR